MPYESKEEEKQKQADLRKSQQLKDQDSTFGTDSKNPCKLEKSLSLRCLDTHLQRSDCKIFFENYNNCLKFWNAVREFRVRRFNLHERPDDKEREKYKKQLGNWLETKKIVDPDTNM